MEKPWNRQLTHASPRHVLQRIVEGDYLVLSTGLSIDDVCTLTDSEEDGSLAD